MKDADSQKKLKTIEKLTNVVDWALVQECFDKYYSIDKDLVTITAKLLLKHPILFNRFVISSTQPKNLINTENALKKHSVIIKGLKEMPDIITFSQNADIVRSDIENELSKLVATYGVVKSRVKSAESIQTNIKNGNNFTLTDVIGFRIVPKSNASFVQLVRAIETTLEDILFKINILSYSPEEATKNIGSNSVHYKSIHYHLNRGKYMCEIQVRGKYTDVWSELSHVGLYKPQIQLTSVQKTAILEFGLVTNTVDFLEFLNS